MSRFAVAPLGLATGRGTQQVENFTFLIYNEGELTTDFDQFLIVILCLMFQIPYDAFQSLFKNNPTIETLELSNCLGVTDALIPVIIKTLKRLRKIDVEVRTFF